MLKTHLSLWSRASSEVRTDIPSSVTKWDFSTFSGSSLRSRKLRSRQSIPRSRGSESTLVSRLRPNFFASSLTLWVPNITESSARAVMSSGARKNGYERESMEIMITPTAHISMAVVWFGCLRRTSGGRKPGVPALGACIWGRDKHPEQTLGFPAQEHGTWDRDCSGFGRAGTEL